jgi:hypothetical protein
MPDKRYFRARPHGGLDARAFSAKIGGAMLRFLARLIAVLCAAAFVFLTIGVIFFQAAGTRFLQSPIYKRALLRERVYERFPTLVADAAVRIVRLRAPMSGDTQEALSLLAQLTPADWQQLAAAIAPAPYLRTQGERGLDQLAESLHADNGPLTVKLSLVELKQRLTGPEVAEAYLAILQARPPATRQQIEQAQGLPPGRRPPDDLMPQVRAQIHTALRTLADRLPDTYDLFAGGPRLGTERAATALSDAQERLVDVERWARWSPALPALLLLLVALFGVRSLRGWLLWWGVPCFLAGLAAALLALPVVPVSRWVFAVLVTPLFPPESPAALMEAIFGLMAAVVQEMMTAALISAAVLAGAGLLAMIAGHFCPRRGPPASRAAASP